MASRRHATIHPHRILSFVTFGRCRPYHSCATLHANHVAVDGVRETAFRQSHQENRSKGEIMVKVKSVVTAAMMLCAAGAMANNFRVADQVYVPAAAHAAGASGTFISDVFISNLSTDGVAVTVLYGSGTTGTLQSFGTVANPLITLAAGERREIPDFMATPQAQGGLGLTVAFGQLIFNACKAGGNCTVGSCPGGDPTAGTCPDFRPISVETRVYSIPPPGGCTAIFAAAKCAGSTQPTTGQLFAGLPWYSFASSDALGPGLDKVFITGFRNNTDFRSNIGVVNASQFSTTTIVLKLFDGKTNTQIGSNATITLAPFGHTQILISDARLFPSFTGATATNAYVTVEQTNTIPTADAAANGCTNGCPAFFAYGSVLDNLSGDATTLEPQFMKPLTDAAISCIFNTICKGAFVAHRPVKH
jgi:hypothetical protein